MLIDKTTTIKSGVNREGLRSDPFHLITFAQLRRSRYSKCTKQEYMEKRDNNNNNNKKRKLKRGGREGSEVTIC